MCHITSGKVKTSMLLIWASPDGEDIYDNFNLPPHLANDVDHVLQWFKEYCEPICNFRATCFKFTKASQWLDEAIDMFYNRIVKLAHQCNFSENDECLIDARIFGTNCVKAQDKLLQTSKTLSLQQCLTVCQHYESLKLHIQQIRPRSNKYIELLNKCHPKNMPGSSQNQGNLKYQSRSLTTDTRQQSQSQRMNKTQRNAIMLWVWLQSS